MTRFILLGCECKWSVQLWGKVFKMKTAPVHPPGYWWASLSCVREDHTWEDRQAPSQADAMGHTSLQPWIATWGLFCEGERKVYLFFFFFCTTFLLQWPFLTSDNTTFFGAFHYLSSLGQRYRKNPPWIQFHIIMSRILRSLQKFHLSPLWWLLPLAENSPVMRLKPATWMTSYFS